MKQISQTDIKVRKGWGDVKPYTRIEQGKKGKGPYKRREKHQKREW